MTVETVNERDPFAMNGSPTPRVQQQLGGGDQFERMGRWLELFMGTAEVAKHLAQTSFVPDVMRGKPADIAAAMMRGLELGIDPLDALANLYVIKGKVGFSAEFMRRRVLEAGHEIVFDEQTDERCKVRGRRRGSQDWTTVVFTKHQAQIAGVQNMGKFAADMLVARATSRLCRRVFPDVLSGAQIVEDIIDGVVVETPTDTAAPAAGSRQVLQRKPRRIRNRQSMPDDEITASAADTVEPASDIDEFPGAPGHDGGNDASQGVEPSSGATPFSDSHDQDTPEEPPTAAMNRKMHALFRDAGLTDRDDRLTVTGMILGYQLDTSANLTKSEASTLIDKLEEWQQNDELGDMITEILNLAALAAENTKSEESNQ